MTQKKRHRYTREQIEYLRKISKGKRYVKIQQLFNERFQTNVSVGSIRQIMYRNKIKSGAQRNKTSFKKGHKAWNKGMKGLRLGGEEGWFKKGNVPPGYKPVGSETIKDGYVMIKVADPDVWRKKHHVIWEQANGPIPEGMVLTFADGDRTNVTLDNLILTQRRVCTTVVRKGFKQEHPALNKAVHKWVELDFAIKDAKKRVGS